MANTQQLEKEVIFASRKLGVSPEELCVRALRYYLAVAGQEALLQEELATWQKLGVATWQKEPYRHHAKG